MPLGLVIMKWDARAGIKVLSNYPEDFVIDNKTLIHVYTTHEYSAEAGLILVEKD